MDHRTPLQRRRVALVLSLLLLSLAACAKDDRAATTPNSPGASGRPGVTVTVDDRPFQLVVPSSYDAAEPVPLILGLHGYTSNSAELDSYFGLTTLAEERGFLLALPDGLVDSGGEQFWNATDYCCDLYGSGVDDSTYLSDLIKAVEDSYAVDAVFLIGHSNGGFMSHRMACEHADQVTAIAALAGVLWTDSGRCAPSRPVSVLQIHGTADATIAYAGTSAYPGAEETVARWRDLDGCTGTADTTAAPQDFDSLAAGPETTITTYADGCGGGASVQLWRMAGSGHVPAVTSAFTPAILDFLYASRPG